MKRLVRPRSAALYKRASQKMVGGVSSPVRAFKAVGGEPLFIAKGRGSKIWDADGNRLTDYVCSWGALILGHSSEVVLRKVIESLENGSSFGAPSEPELLLAEKVCKTLPSLEMVRFVNSGTEATMSAIRLARACTKRSKVVKFEGCYHGHADPFLVKGGSGLATFGIPSSPGVLSETISNTITIPYNDIESVRAVFRDRGSQIACVIVEPVAGNMGVIPPQEGFLEVLRKVCDESGSLLIFDEVITGFRVSRRGAQGLYGVNPDITCLGKIIGGGFPVGAYGGRKEIMKLVAPEGPVYQAGTLSGNPVAMTAGLETISLLNESVYGKLGDLSRMLAKGLERAAEEARTELTINRVGSMTSLFFTGSGVTNFGEVKKSRHGLYPRFFWGMLDGGIYLPPSPFESIFLSAAHSRGDIEQTIEAARSAFGTA